MRVLVTGANGQLGHDLVPAFADAGHDVVAPDRSQLDVADRDSVLQVLTSVRPDAVVHAAAWTAVDDCEADPDRAWRVNALGTRHVVEGARRVGAHLCALSTDYVFDGTKAEPYVEWDPPNPTSAYGWSKRGGELEVDPSACVVRTAWVCGAHGRNMVKTVLGLLDQPELAFVDDQRGSPTFTADLAPAIVRLVGDRRPGVFHVTNQGTATWFELVRETVGLAGGDPGRVRPITTAELDPPRPAPRPANSVLDNAALRLSDLPLLPNYRESLERLVKELLR